MAAPSPTPLQTAATTRRRSLLARIDRRILRSVIYSVVMLLLFALFKAAEWFIEHKVAGGEQLSIPLAVGIALSLGAVFQLSHKRVEDAVADWLNRAARTREQGLNDLAQEILLIRDAGTLKRRVVDRLDQVLETKGSALYLTVTEEKFDLAISTYEGLPAEVSCDDPALLHAMLQRSPTAPAARGSKLPLPMIWPIIVRGRMTGFIGAGSRERNESLDEFQIKAVGRVADAVGSSLALLDSSLKTQSPLTLPARPSIAVLPFQNLSGDPEQEYFADGTVEEITTALSRFRSLFVIARNSSFTYKGRAIDVKQVGRELGVRYVLEGSVRKSGDNVRITGQLIDALTGAHLWADRFDGKLADIFDLQDQITASVVGAILPKLEEAEIERTRRKPTESLEAYDYYLRGLALANHQSREANDEALRLFYKAIQLDSGFAAAYALAARCFIFRKTNGWMTDRMAEIDEAARLARCGIELGKDDAVALSHVAHVLAYVVGDLDHAASICDHALALNANAAVGWGVSGFIKVLLGEPDAGIERVAHAMRLSPRDPLAFAWYLYTSIAHFYAGRNDEATSWSERGLRELPNHPGLLRSYAASSASAGRFEDARKAMERLRQLAPSLRLSNLEDVLPPARRPEDRRKYVEALRKAGLPE